MLIRYPQFLEICKYFQDDLQILTFIEKLACGHELSKDYLAHLENDKHEFILMLKQTQVTVSLEKKNTKTIREEMIDNYFSKCIDENKLTVDQSQKLLSKTYLLFQNKIITSKNFNIVQNEICSIKF